MKNKLLIVACLVIVLSMALILPLSIVNADYSDIVNDPNSIVNFNQLLYLDTIATSNYSLVNNYTIKLIGSSSTGVKANITSHQFSFQYGNKYYLKGNAGFTLYFSNGGAFPFNAIYDFTNNNNWNSILCTGVYANDLSLIQSNVNYSFGVYNLTAMFGQGSEPTLAQCQDLFVADYYMYNSGTAMSFGSVNAYQQALSDITNSYSFNLSVSALGLNSFAYNYKNVTSSFYFNQQYNFWYYENTFGTPLFTTLSSGTKLNIEFNMYASNSGYQEHLHLAVWYLNNQSDLVNIYIDPQGINYYSDEVNNISFVLPTSVDTLYFNVYDDRTQAVDTSSNSFVLLFNISAQQFDLNTAITNAFITGQKTIMSSYQVGGDKYQEIWQAGYTNGLNAETPYTFANLMSSVVEAPLNAVLSIFNFDFLGYNFRNVITLILTLCIILAIIRLFIGMGGSE